ncbi:MAG: hypothetical protein RMM29_06990 [Planctomycetota bacterium]|nr:hypothetical protein [Planctomycetota bacterium]
MTEDRGFKELFVTYPRETLAVFVPELLAERGEPVQIIPLQQELAPPQLSEASSICDLALLCQWADGRSSIIVLVEHWSRAEEVDLERMLWYALSLRRRHRGADVVPVVLVTDPRARAVPEEWRMEVANREVMRFRVWMVRVGAEDIPRLRAMQNRVAAVLMGMALREVMDAVEAAVAVLAAMREAPGRLEDLVRFLPLVRKLVRMHAADEERFRRRLREERSMQTLLEEVWTQARQEGLKMGIEKGRAEGEAIGKKHGEALGKLAEIQRLVAKGRLSVDAARAEIEELLASGAVPEDLAREALAQLG